MSAPVPDSARGRADLHIHSDRSDGCDGPLAVVERALRLDLAVIAIADHDTIEGARVAAGCAAGIEGAPAVVVGEEVSSADGHIVGLYLTEPIPPRMPAEATLAAIHDQGGLAVAVHPFWRMGVRDRRGLAFSVGELIAHLPFDAVELRNGSPVPDMWLANRRARLRSRRLRLAGLGGSDAHVKEAVGWACTTFPGDTAEALRLAIRAGETAPAGRPPGPGGLVRYAGWALGRGGPRPS